MRAADLAFPLHMTEEEFFALEETSEERHEWYRGKVFAMAGGSPNHNQIAGNLYVELTLALRGRPCRIFFADLLVNIRACALNTYPDIQVICGGLQYAPGRSNVVTNPTLIAEVLSDSTEAYDRGKKRDSYRSLPSLQEYVLLDQHMMLVETYQRREDGWHLRTYDQETGMVLLESLSIEIPLTRLYQQVEWDAET